MRLSHRLVTRAASLHPPPRTVRLRLTLLYGGLFLVSGVVLLGITYILVSRSGHGVHIYRGPNGVTGAIAEQASHRPSGAAPAATYRAPGESGPPGAPRPGRIEELTLRQHAAEMDRLLTESGIALSITAVFSIGLGWLVAGRILRPLRTITTAVRDISSTSLHQRLALGGPRDELRELGDTFDGLLARLEAAFQAQRRFVANASHELRTPLARQRTLTQVALADPDATVESLRAAHERVLAAGTQQERLIEALLTLSRGQAGLAEREPFDLAELTDQVVAARRAEAIRKDVDIGATLASAGTDGDPRLAERLAANLLDNALRHNVPSGRIEVVTAAEDGQAVLTVANTGPRVPATEIDRLFQPFQRLGAERTGPADGLGLGLSIVRAIATAHGATVTASPRPEGGLTVEVRFPRHRSADHGDAGTHTHPRG